MNTPTFTFRLPAALRARVERAALNLGITEADVVRRALATFLGEHDYASQLQPPHPTPAP